MVRSAITVREYARLTTSEVDSSLDAAKIPESAFNWLCENLRGLGEGGLSIVSRQGQQQLLLDQYVGVIETPCGTVIEILPKTSLATDSPQDTRALLVRMLQRVYGIQPRTMGPANLVLFDHPVSEWVISQFLFELDILVKKGIRFDYQEIEEESRFLKGRLHISKQMRQPPGRQHLFQIIRDRFLPDRPENRLLKRALSMVSKRTKLPYNWRLANELMGVLQPVPESRDVDRDMKKWSGGRLMAHYEDVRHWCELILKMMNPTAQSGGWRGVSLLYDMNDLFEKYVGIFLKREIAQGFGLVEQSARKSLCIHKGENRFRLRPDFLVSDNSQTVILDTKWKLLDLSLNNSRDKYGLSQADFYQLYAYGQKCMDGHGDLFLVYPKHGRFVEPIAHPFLFEDDLRLWVVPFDLEGDQLMLSPLLEQRSWLQKFAAEKLVA